MSCGCMDDDHINGICDYCFAEEIWDLARDRAIELARSKEI